MDSSVEPDLMAPSKQSYMREAAEQNVLAYILALIYEQNPRQWILERGLVFTPMIAKVLDASDPAAKSCSVMVDFDNMDVSTLNANFLAQLTGTIGANRAKNSVIKTVFRQMPAYHSKNPHSLNSFRCRISSRVQLVL